MSQTGDGLLPTYQYLCSNGHYCAGPRPLKQCLRPNCTGSLQRVGKGAKS